MKKILSLILALCMCLAVLVACMDNNATNEETGTKKPAASQSESSSDDTDPEDTDPQETEPDDTDNGNEGEQGGNESTPEAKTIEIGSVAEWEALAKDGDPDKEDFLGKTVKLTANIDFGTETATTLFKTFAGTFDGGNFTVKGKSASRMSLLANTLDGATVKNLTVDGFAISCPVDGAENSSVIAANAMTKDVTFENITVKNCSINADKATAGNKGVGFILGEAKSVNVVAKKITVTACEVTAANKNSSRVGGVVGFMLSDGLSTFEDIKVNMNTNAHAFTGGIVGLSYGTGNLNFSKIKVTGTFNSPGSTGGSETIGGIFGAKYNESAAAGESFVKNAFVDVKLYCTSNSGRAGAIGGYWYKGQNSSANITIENCYLKGEWSVRKDETMRNRSGGIFGEYGAKNSTLTLKNVILEAAVDQTWSGSNVTPDVTKIGGSNSALIINYENTKVDGVLSHVIAATDCYTTIVSDKDGNPLELPAGFTGVTSDKTAAMVTYDASGYVSEINAPAAS